MAQRIVLTIAWPTGGTSTGLGDMEPRQPQFLPRPERKLGDRRRRQERVRAAGKQRQRRVPHQETGRFEGLRRRPQLGPVVLKRRGELLLRPWRVGHPQGQRDAGGVGDVTVTADGIERPRAVALVAAEEAVGLGHMDPAKEMRIVRPVRSAVRVGPGYVPMDTPDVVDGALRVLGRAVRGGRQEGTRPLQPTPRVVAVIGVLRDRDHGPRVQRLEQQREKTADEHRGVPVHAADRPVRREPARSRRVEPRPVGRSVGTRDPCEQRLAQLALERVQACD